MKKLLILTYLLFTSLVTLSMDDSPACQQSLAEERDLELSDIYYDALEDVSSDENKSPNWQWLKVEFIPYMKTVSEMPNDLQGSLESISYIPEVAKYISLDTFKDVMFILAVYIHASNEGISSKLLRMLEMRLGIDSNFGQVIEMLTCDGKINDKGPKILAMALGMTYTLEQLITMLASIVFFHIDCLYDPILDALTHRLFAKITSREIPTENVLNQLSNDVQKSLKKRLVKLYGHEMWLALGGQCHVEQLLKTPQYDIKTTNKYIISTDVTCCEVRNLFGELVKTITLEDLQKETNRDDITKIKLTYVDEDYIVLVTDTQIILFSFHDLNQMYATFDQESDEDSKCEIFITPDKSKLIAKETKAASANNFLRIFDIATSEKLAGKRFPYDFEVDKITNQNLTIHSSPTPADQKTLAKMSTYDINKLKLVSREKIKIKIPDSSRFIVRLDRAKRFKIVKRILGNKHPKNIEFSDDNRILFAYCQENVIQRNMYCTFLFTLWPYLKSHSLYDILLKVVQERNASCILCQTTKNDTAYCTIS